MIGIQVIPINLKCIFPKEYFHLRDHTWILVHQIILQLKFPRQFSGTILKRQLEQAQSQNWLVNGVSVVV